MTACLEPIMHCDKTSCFKENVFSAWCSIEHFYNMTVITASEVLARRCNCTFDNFAIAHCEHHMQKKCMLQKPVVLFTEHAVQALAQLHVA